VTGDFLGVAGTPGSVSDVEEKGIDFDDVVVEKMDRTIECSEAEMELLLSISVVSPEESTLA